MVSDPVFIPIGSLPRTEEDLKRNVFMLHLMWKWYERMGMRRLAHETWVEYLKAEIQWRQLRNKMEEKP